MVRTQLIITVLEQISSKTTKKKHVLGDYVYLLKHKHQTNQSKGTN